jgi:ABC-type antimicrobial peptide transport system permease subunit
MFKNYLKIALRNFAKHKYFSIVNAFGLAMGMSVGLLVISFYSYVSSFDDFHSQNENTYRVISTLEKGTDRKDLASAPAVLANRLQHEHMGIKEVVRINSSFNGDVVSSKLNIPIQGYYADENFFSVFDFEMIHGDPATALAKPNSIVLTESMAKKLTGSDGMFGSVIEIDGLGNFEVTGIVKDQRRTHFSFESLVSFSTLPDVIQGEENSTDQWMSYNNQYIYLVVNNFSDREKLQHALDRIANEMYSQSNDTRAAFKLQALADITPGLDLENPIGPGDTDYIILGIFVTIALLILLPACFNYTNISIARALKRSKEIGLRKTMGGLKTQIFIQLITETVVMAIVSLAGAVIIFIMIRPEFESLMGGRSLLDLSLTWQMFGTFLLFAVAVGFVAGIFPALHFAGLNPIQVLRGYSNSKAFSKIQARRVLIIFQFALSFCFIVLVTVFSRQYRYTLNFDLGFNKESILNVELQGVDPATFRSELSKLSSVRNVSMSSDILGLSYSSTAVHDRHTGDSIEVFQLFVDARFIDNMELTLLAGENFPADLSGTERHILVNEEFLKARQITNPMDVLGRTFVVEGKDLEVIGVTKNFHFAPLQEPIKSFFLRTAPAQFSYANLKVVSTDIHGTLILIEEAWRKLSDRTFQAQFFDKELEEAYSIYNNLLKMIGFLGMLAISISLLGLLGMVVYSAETRTKEVGIRKVLGASVANINYLLSKDFMKLMLWAIAFGVPISILLFDDLLSGLQHYRVRLNVWDIVVGLIIFFLTGVATIASQTCKTANTNPVDTLRYE